MDIKHDVISGMAYSYINGVKGTLRQTDVQILQTYASQIPRNGIYAETGSYMGASSILAGLVTKHGVRVYAHDVWVEDMDQLTPDGAPPPKTDNYFFKFYKNIIDNQLTRTVIPIRGPSQWTLGIHEDKSIDLAFIDGDHSYEGVKGDLKAIWEKMKPKSTILLHDCSHGSKTLQGVMDFCNDNKLDLNAFSQTDMEMIQVPDKS